MVENQSNSIVLKQRSVSMCDNLLVNGDFEDYQPNNDCIAGEFKEGWVPPWEDFGTSDLWSIEGSQFCTWDCVRYAHANSIGKNEAATTGIVGVEGLQQEVNIVSDPDIYYSLSLEATTTLGTESIFNAYFLQGAPLFDPMETPDLSNGFLIVRQAIIGPGCGVSDWPVIEQDNIYPDQDYNNFFVFVQSNSGNSYLLQDNYELLCHSRLLNGIKTEALSRCQYVFEADFLGPLDVLQYEWDFGDGSMSSSATPTHTFSPGGLYQVSLTVKDANGCCTTVTTVVSCGEVESCLTYACWEQIQTTTTAPFEECAYGIELLIEGDCKESPITLMFSQINNVQACNDAWYDPIIPAIIPFSTNYCEIKQQIMVPLDAAGVNYIIEEERDMIQDCYKGTNVNAQVPGFFITVEGAKFNRLLLHDCQTGQDLDAKPFEFIGSDGISLCPICTG